MARGDYYSDKHVFRHHLIPESNEQLDVGMQGQRFGVIRAREIIGDILTFVSLVLNTLTVSTQLTLSYLTGGYVKSDGSGNISAQATPIPITDGGTNATTAADARTQLGLGTIATQNANNVSITGGSITSITDLAVADGGTGASTAAAARTNLAAAPADPQFLVLAANSELSGERIFTPGKLLSATDGGAGAAYTLNVRDIAVVVFHSANQTIATGTDTVVAWDSEDYDTDSMHDTATNNSRLTAQRSGKYLVWASAIWGTESATGTRRIRLRHNGTTFLAGQDAAGSTVLNITQTIAREVNLAANDYVELVVHQNSGGNMTFVGNNPHARFGMRLLAEN